MNKSIVKPYLHFIGNNASSVTGSCTIVRYNNIKLCVDMGLIQTNNIVADYRANREQLKKIKPKTIHGVIILHCHADHLLGILPAVAAGMKAHIYVPEGSIPLIKIMLEDCVKILMQDSAKLQNKHGIKAPPLAEPQDVEKVLSWIEEIPFNKPTEIVGGAKITLYDAGHIINSAQCVLEIKQGDYVTKKIGFTSDFNTEQKSKSVKPIQPLPRCNIVVGECTYSDPKRCYSMKKDRWYDKEMMKTALEQYHRILCPVFALQRAEDILETLKDIGTNIPIYLDSPLAERIYRSWPEPLDYENTLNLRIVQSWDESKTLQTSNEHCLILAPSGMLTAGRSVCYLKYLLPSEKNCVLFCGYSSENTVATEIKRGAKEIKVDGELVKNKAQIYCLNTFSSHANYNQLMEYYQTIDYDKLCLVHSNYDTKVTFAQTLQDKLASNGKSARVIAVNADTKIYI